MREEFRVFLRSHLASIEQITDFLEVFKTHTSLDGMAVFYSLMIDFSLELYSTFQFLIQREQSLHDCVPTVDGGVFFSAMKDRRQLATDYLPLTEINFDGADVFV